MPRFSRSDPGFLGPVLRLGLGEPSYFNWSMRPDREMWLYSRYSLAFPTACFLQLTSRCSTANVASFLEKPSYFNCLIRLFLEKWL